MKGFPGTKAQAVAAAMLCALTGAPQATSQSLEEVVVTAEKRETNLQKTPVAISVMGAEQLADRHIQSLGDLTTSGPPSLRIAPSHSSFLS